MLTDSSNNTLLWVAISTFSPAGTFRVSFLVGFVCPCIMLSLWRVLHCLAARVLPVVSRCSTQKRHVITCSTEQLSSRQYSAHAVDFCTNRFLRASAVVENRSLANCAVRHLSSNRAVDFCVYGVETIWARRDVRQSFEPFAVQPLFGGRREET